MRNILSRFLLPPIFEGDDQKTRRAVFLHYASLLFFVTNLILFWIIHQFGTQTAKSASWLVMGLALAQVLVQWMLRSGYVDHASFFLLTIGWTLLTKISQDVGGIYDAAIFGYVIVLLVSGYLLGWKVAFAYALTSIAALWWLAYQETAKIFAPVVDMPYERARYLTVIFIEISFVVYFLITTLTKEITERKRAQDELNKLARTDALTGLFNRRYFFELAEKEFIKSVRYERPLSVIILDLDLFKDINDTYGHLVGDQVLIHIGKLLQKTSRAPDISARYGGEEFIMLLTETDCARAKIFSDRLRKLVEETPVQCENKSISLTVSIGVAGKQNKGEETLEILISKADQSLYKAKREGRNRVVCYQEKNEDLSS